MIELEIPAPPTPFRYVAEAEWDVHHALTRALTGRCDAQQTTIELQQRMLRALEGVISQQRESSQQLAAVAERLLHQYDTLLPVIMRRP